MKDTINLSIGSEDNQLMSSLTINGDTSFHYVNPFSFLFYFQESTDRNKDKSYGSSWKDLSEFYPFTCSCGIAGCSSIWNGIIVKWRKNTVEWRLKNRVKDGYKNILDKSYYNFDRSEYEAIATGVYEYLIENQDVYLNYEPLSNVLTRFDYHCPEKCDKLHDMYLKGETL